MVMKRNELTPGKPGGGAGSRVNREVAPRGGKVAEKINPGGVSQLGGAIGNHVTDGPRTTLNYRGDKMIAGDLVRPGQPRMGNEVAFTTQAGPGGSRNLYGQSGTNQQYGPVAGQPWTPGRGFDSRSIVKKV
jgi:hypothetical protein